MNGRSPAESDADAPDPDRRGSASRVPPTPAVAGWIAALVVVSLVPIPGGSGGTGGPTGPELAALTGAMHLVGYAVLAGLSARTTRRGAYGLAAAAALATGVGFGVELLQSTVAWRTFAWSDAGVNAAGAAIGVVAVAVRRRRRRATADDA